MYKFEKRSDVELLENYMNMGESNPSGESIYLNNLYFTKNGKPFNPVMGEMHITRNPRKEWKDRILKLKAQGITIISSYLLWINHEFYEGKIDFSGENDIREFIKICNDCGMYFALRIGPWITSECRNGGLPNWLYEKGITVRDNNDEYLFYVRRWYRAVYEQVKDFLYKNGGNIIMLQLDNELVKNPEHLMKLKEIAIEEGITVPIYTATGWNVKGGALLPKKDVVPMFGGYCAKPWTNGIGKLEFYSHFSFSHIRNSTDVGDDLIEKNKGELNIDNDKYPYAMCELGMGLCTSKHRRPYVSAMDNYSFAITKLGSGCNLLGYYVSCGGINKMIDGVTLNMDNTGFNKNSNTYPIYSYDFQASITEHGALTPTHRKIKLVNYFVNNFGEKLACMQPKLQENKIADNDTDSLRYAMRTDGTGGYIFVNHHCHNLSLNPVKNVRFKTSENSLPIPEKAIDITEDDAFFFPFNIDYDGAFAEYITAQPICKSGNTYFFKKINGIDPIYKFKDAESICAKTGINTPIKYMDKLFITLSNDEAEHLYKFENDVFIADGFDLICDDGAVKPVGLADTGVYYKYNGTSFEKLTCGQKTELAALEFCEVENPDIDKTYQYEMLKNRSYADGKKGEYYFANRRIKYYKLSVSNANGYVHINYSGDSAQLYYNGKMSDDDFYTGNTWVIPAEYMYGKEVILAIAEYTHDIYVDIEPKQACGIDSIFVKAY